MIGKVRQLGWLFVELGVILIAICLVLQVVLGDSGGPVVAAISANALAMLQRVPAGIALAVASLLVVERLLRARLAGPPPAAGGAPPAGPP